MSGNRRAFVTMHSDGNGGRVLSINLTLVRGLMALAVTGLALYAGVAQGVEAIGIRHIRAWWGAEGAPAAQVMIDTAVDRHRAETEIELQQQLAEIHKQLLEVQTIARQNHETTNKLLDAVIAGR